MMSISGASNRSSNPLHAEALNELRKAILVPKIEHLTASILKNPFTMSNTGRLDPITVLSHGEPFLFISRLCKIAFAQASQNDGGAYRDRTDDLMLAKQPLSQLS